jgi:hypothetical protein
MLPLISLFIDMVFSPFRLKASCTFRIDHGPMSRLWFGWGASFSFIHRRPDADFLFNCDWDGPSCSSNGPSVPTGWMEPVPDSAAPEKALDEMDQIIRLNRLEDRSCVLRFFDTSDRYRIPAAGYENDGDVVSLIDCISQIDAVDGIVQADVHQDEIG